MRFLINVNLPRSLGRLLGEAGHSCRHALDVGLGEASDSHIIGVARETGETILTHDVDYGGLLAFLGSSAPSVVIFRIRKINAASLASAMLAAWDRISNALDEGAVVTIDDSAVRVRHLPIRQAN